MIIRALDEKSSLIIYFHTRWHVHNFIDAAATKKGKKMMFFFITNHTKTQAFLFLETFISMLETILWHFTYVRTRVFSTVGCENLFGAFRVIFCAVMFLSALSGICWRCQAFVGVVLTYMINVLSSPKPRDNTYIMSSHGIDCKFSANQSQMYKMY